MTIGKLERVMWRIRETYLSDGSIYITNRQLKTAIMQEIGTDARTCWANRKALMELGWIKRYNTQKVYLTNKDI